MGLPIINFKGPVRAKDIIRFQKYFTQFLVVVNHNFSALARFDQIISVFFDPPYRPPLILIVLFYVNYRYALSTGNWVAGQRDFTNVRTGVSQTLNRLTYTS